MARQLLMYAFAADILESIEIEPVRDELERMTLARYTGAPAASTTDRSLSGTEDSCQTCKSCIRRSFWITTASPAITESWKGADHRAEGKNPLCGDHVQVELVMEDDVIRDVKFTGHGCAISRASASLMTAAVKGKSRADADALFHRFHSLVLGSGQGHWSGSWSARRVLGRVTLSRPREVRVARVAHTASGARKRSVGNAPVPSLPSAPNDCAASYSG